LRSRRRSNVALSDVIEAREFPSIGATTFQRTGHEFTPASEAAVKARIMAIVNYIESIQQK
jgi:hypothetical protein